MSSRAASTNDDDESRRSERGSGARTGRGDGSEAEESQARPHPEDSRKPDSPGKLSGASWKHVGRKTLGEFSLDQCTDLAAGLTYYAVLALFPALIALMSLIGVFGQGPKSVDTLMGIVSDVAGSSVADKISPTVESLSQTPGAGLALLIGLAGALWSASGYVGAFGRAMNRIYQVTEGRPVWKLRPVMLLVTAVLVVMVAASLLILVVSGPVTQAIGDTLGLGSTVVLVWRIAKWPFLLLLVVLVVAILYYTTPNVKPPKFKWMSIGALVAIVVWIVLSALFAFYVANFSSYNKTYGALAGVIVFLLWLWLTNLSLLFGAELDAEIERGRELQAGIEAEEDIQLPARDTTNIEKAEAKHDKDLEQGRKIRDHHQENS